MDIKIPKTFDVQNRSRDIGESLELSNEDLEIGVEHPLFIYMLKYLMAPMTENLKPHSTNMKVLLQPDVLEQASAYNADMDVNAKEYQEHISKVWDVLTKSVMYDLQQPKDDDGDKVGEEVEKGILGLLVNQTWVEDEEKQVIRKLIENMPKTGQETTFLELLDLEDKGKKTIGTEGQKKIFGYRTGAKASELYASGEQGKPYYPILRLLSEVVESTDTGKNDRVIKRGTIDNETVIEYRRNAKIVRWQGEDVVNKQTVVIHFDRLFQILRDRYGIGNVKRGSKNVKPMREDSKQDILKGEETDYLEGKIIPLENNQIKESEQYNRWEVKSNITKPEKLSAEEEHLFRRIIIKIEFEKQQDSGDIEASIIHHLYQYNIIDNLSDGDNEDSKGEYSDMLEQHNKGKWKDKYGKMDLDFTTKEKEVIEKIVDTEDLTDPMKKLKILLTTETISDENARAAKEARLSSRPVIQTGDSGIFNRIADPELNSIKLRKVRSGEFKTELTKAITPGVEGKLEFSFGQIRNRNTEGLVLLDIEFTPYVKVLGYADYIGDKYSNQRGKGKFIPSNMDNLSGDLTAGGKDRKFWLQNIKGSSAFLYYMKKQLTRLNRMVAKNV